MDNHPTLQVQSVIYKNEPEALIKAVLNLANAVRVEQNERAFLGQVSMHYGDASPERVLSEAQVKELQERVEAYLDFHYCVFGFNSGSAKGHNILGKDCNTDYMMTMNPDVIVSPRFLIEIMMPFLNKKAGMVEARQTPIEHQKEYDIDTKETDWATTACAVFRTSIFKKLDGFDSENFFMYCDDLDFSWRLRLLDYLIIYQPLAPVFHAKRLTNKGGWKPTNAEVFYSAQANLMMAHKWSNPERVERLLNAYRSNPDENWQKAAEHFIELRKEGKLPAPIDPEHKVGKFIGDYYAENRFIL